MGSGLRGRDLLSMEDLSREEILEILDLASQLKREQRVRRPHRLLRGRTLALIFEKPSLRTRVTLEVAMRQLGGDVVSLTQQDIGLGVRESVADVARNLSRWVDGIAARVFSHRTLEDLARAAEVAVINALSDREHPCQTLADLLTIREKFGTFQGTVVAWVGDGNNVCHSLLLGGVKVGLSLRVATPEGYEPDRTILEAARNYGERTGARILLTHRPEEAVRGAQVVYTDVWTSMGQEAEREKRRRAFAGFQVNEALLAHSPEALVMHCLPAHRGEEITDAVLDGPRSVVLDQAENRLHVQKALLALVLGG
ncbi:MAG: ornithine carbamoyltransferase [Armatimonadota bacterium]|nr:ornithine carbamoyltransferase [Armatimonadota bacterium]MDR7444243.1 ornithine carbamoyltransferase [Armatimonadota bacterium]MDR7570510.1 ornithine carbamoyltransferase [Armatimonadota bacterium]MDR7614223.1 ornithine carbamoyltransferase [Armatimonadota bacterium]